MSISSLKFRLFHSVKNQGLLDYYNEMMNNNYKTIEELELKQFADLSRMILFVYEHVPFYRKFMLKHDIRPSDVLSLEDLNKFPIINKKIIRENYNDFLPNIQIKYISGTTGGTTGQPFKYRMSHDDYLLGRAILWRGFSFAGYKLGDRIMTIAGGSLVPNSKNKIRDFLIRNITNNYSVSSYNLDEEKLLKFIKDFNRLEPKFLRGYASSLNLVSKYILDNNIKLNHIPNGIFSTAEMLLPEYRVAIEKAFSTRVYDQYGLNDGGVAAFECKFHKGYHIATERSILQVVDFNGNIVKPGEQGRIIATNLHNFAMPLIRYETGDMGVVSDEVCECGLPYRMLSKIVGRIDDFIKTPNGDNIHSGFLRMIIKKREYIDQFQAIQENIDCIRINIVLNKSYTGEFDIDSIINEIKSKLKDFTIKINLCESIDHPPSGKLRFFISEI